MSYVGLRISYYPFGSGVLHLGMPLVGCGVSGLDRGVGMGFGLR
jgi:hypothetical protein